MNFSESRVAVIGAGPAGLMAAEILARAGVRVTVYDRMAAPARKFLLAGRGGLNLTHSEDFSALIGRYGEAEAWLKPILEAFPPMALRAWADGLGAQTFVGTSGRVFPQAMTAAALLQAWLLRLTDLGVAICPRHTWWGWDDANSLVFGVADATTRVQADATLLALGGASWPQMGSNGAWVDILTDRGVAVSPLRPANCGFACTWSARFKGFAGEPLKSLGLTFGHEHICGEAMVTEYGIEGGGIYALSRSLRDAIAADGVAELCLDLRPQLTVEAVSAKLAAVRHGQSLSSALRKALHLAPVAINLMREVHGIHLPADPPTLARCVKRIPLRLVAPAPIERAISSAGGIKHEDLDETLQLRRLPGVFAAGEMLDWEAPTGGYLLTACFATGVAAAHGILRTLQK